MTLERNTKWIRITTILITAIMMMSLCLLAHYLMQSDTGRISRKESQDLLLRSSMPKLKKVWLLPQQDPARNVYTTTPVYSSPAIESAASHTTTLDLSQEEREEFVWKTLKNLGMSDTSAAAVMGNFRAESGVCEFRLEHHTPEESSAELSRLLQERYLFVNSNYGFGLAQWTGYCQLCALWDWCEAHNYQPDDVVGQIEYLLYNYESKRGDSFRRFTSWAPKDLLVATEDFRQTYERSHWSEASIYRRQHYAKQYFLKYSTASDEVKAIVEKEHTTYDIYIKVQERNKALCISTKG